MTHRPWVLTYYFLPLEIISRTQEIAVKGFHHENEGNDCNHVETTIIVSILNSPQIDSQYLLLEI